MPISPTGALIVDNPMDHYLMTKNSKLVGAECNTHGDDLVGPPGFYCKAKHAWLESKKGAAA